VKLIKIIRTSLMAALLLGLLSACSTIKLAYNNANELAWWWLTDYVSFSEPQRPAMRQAMVQVHEWHRRQQLPGYVDLLGRWQGAVQGELGAAQVCTLADEVVQRLEDLSGAVEALDTAALQAVASLSAAQLAELERRQAKSNTEFREKFLSVPPQELATERFKQGVSRAENLYGRLQPEQKKVLASALSASPWDANASYARRVKRQQALVQSLRALQNAPAEQVRAGLKTMLARSMVDADPADRAASLAARKQMCSVVAALHQSTTREQRSKAVDTLKGYASELRTLVQGAPL
jgi:hypothetical protein